VPLPPWEKTTVTLIGDAIHTMTPGRGVGANTALRDARLLSRKLTAAGDGQLPVMAAIHDCETQMIRYGFDAVRASRKQMSGSGLSTSRSWAAPCWPACRPACGSSTACLRSSSAWRKPIGPTADTTAATEAACPPATPAP
jgi:2-polyprenyl-6-methoxyphenol hydroxylase-like FAD-dependent oxidoreductase